MSEVLGGRVAVVTGANHGIGAAVAVELARLGADVLVTYLRLPPDAGSPQSGLAAAYGTQRRRSADHVAAAVGQMGRRCVPMEADLADPAAAGRVFDAAERELGAVSILVNNASGWRPDTFSGATTDQFNRPVQPVSAETISAQLDVDARGGALLIAELSGRLRRHGHRWGRIVSLSSGGGDGFPDEVSYGAAKAALQNFTLSAAVELADIGVTANVVHPPITDTGWVTEEVRRFARAHDVRVVQPDEVASVVGWLCTDAARLVTGNVVRLH